MKTDDTYLTVPEAARILKVASSWVYEHTRKGTIPVVRLGKYVRLPQKEFWQWLELGCPADWRAALTYFERKAQDEKEARPKA